ncbi:leucine--tRNA ligase [Deinococcus roseus]|uniref:Leucine--tRNA ligase n=1 Tax=Deinococcus roseus TaxID=392414 RepID=A0ABQ2D4Y9_9DEIO|nr:leucine--tRNA ligase [Deinococcus roseus]GGJ40311.1 leucine--tRNA ligase [Deinococcus roseus]
MPRSEKYNPHSIEPRWRKSWEESDLYTFKHQEGKENHYALTMFPYPSGNLHIGHWYAFAVPDARARFMRMKGYNVLFPMGFDAFGLPAENAAIKRNIDPAKWTYSNIEYMTGQFKRMGTMIDWSKQFATCDPEYYKWNQWFFIQFYKQGLVYKKNGFVNWCPSCNTVLANEQVVDGKCERCGTVVVQKKLEQWFFKITEYADELLDFGTTDMPERVRLMQHNWIGKSVGAEIDFATDAGTVTVFSTRPDTLMGATFLVLAPEHAFVKTLTTPEQQEAVQNYIDTASKMSEIDRQAEGREKTGVWTGAYATHPVTGEKLPIWIADYVLVTYGTGSIMAVPAHDSRDFDFARQFDLPVKEVIRGETPMPADATEPYSDEGAIVNSGILDGMQGGKEFIGAVIEKLADYGVRARTTYRLRDWLISRQRYWGTPIPMVYCEKCGIQPVSESELPVKLPEDVRFQPTGQSPLTLMEDWKTTTCPCCGGVATRETDTMDTFVDSSWYMYRYLSHDVHDAPFRPEFANFTPDVYTGGIEHAILHLLYSRFWTKAMRDLGLTEVSEPFKVLRNQGIILGEDNEKMSKSRGNVIDPDDLVAEYGADTVRAFLMFLAPWEAGGPWSSKGIQGPHKWLNRIWSLYFDAAEGPEEAVTEAELRFAVHAALKRVTDDLERFSFNTCIAAMMELTNTLVKAKRSPVSQTQAWTEALDIFNRMLAPFVPYIAEEIWSETGHSDSVHVQSWPQYDANALVKDEIEVVVQVNGKLRGKALIRNGASQEEVFMAAKSIENVQKFIEGKPLVKEIYVPGRLVNIVVKG